MDLAICRNCGERITWLKSAAGKNVAVNLESIGPSNIKATVFDKTTMVSHFGTCAKMPPKAEPAGGAPAPQSSAGGPRASVEREYREQQAGPVGEEPPPLTDDDLDVPWETK